MSGKNEGGRGERFTTLQTAQLLLEEWKFRQTHCWWLLQKFGLAAIAVSIAPYASAQFLPPGRPYLPWLLAVLGFVLEFIVAWLFAAEYIRCQRRGQAYDTLLRDKWPLGAPEMPKDWEDREKWFAPKIGWFTFRAFIVISMVTLGVNIYVLSGSPSAAAAR